MKSRAGRIVSTTLRWLVAVLGVAWVVSNLHWRDRVLVQDDGERDWPNECVLAEPAAEDATAFRVATADGVRTFDRHSVVNGPDRMHVTRANGTVVKLLGMRLDGDINRQPVVRDLLVLDADPVNGGTTVITIRPGEVQGGFKLDVPQPRVMTGLGTMLRNADASKLAMAVLVAPLPFFFTTVRWRKLLQPLGIGLSFGTAFVLNMVGAFYNTFMPGSTGGDVLKAYYAAKHAPDRRTAAVMSVVIDRVIGLIALVMLGGTMAAVRLAISAEPDDPVTRACQRVAVGAGLILLGCVVGLVVLFTPHVRRVVANSGPFTRSKAYGQLRKVLHVMQAYRGRPLLVVWAVLFTLPVHLTTVVSAMLAGQAFGLPLSNGYYFVVVPVIVLAGAIPVSPQGVGVMEAFAYYFTRPQGATLNQALALTMSIRLVAVFWNLTGGLFVLRGGYHAPTVSQQNAMDAEADAADRPVARHSPAPG